MLNTKPEKKKTVFIGLSGGVDSSVSAALLKKEGWDAVGVFIKVWQPDWLECTWREDRRDAMRVCAHLDIPFLELDLEEEYKRDVVDYMIEEYKAGRTPNPDVMCNKYIKFGGFLDWALKRGADYVATGHYARVAQSTTDNLFRFSFRKSRILNPDFSRESGQLTTYQLLKGVDDGKDQSYFLWTLSQDQLSKVIFPVGGYRKEYVRKLARKFDLSTAEKKDSQGVCFLGKLDMKEFLKHYIDEKRGDVLLEKGEVVGWHPGAVFFTLGERHGFTITKKGVHNKPYYIVDKDASINTLTVSHMPLKSEIAHQGQVGIRLKNVNWILDIPELNRIYQARIRHLGELHECQIASLDQDRAVVKLKNSLLASPGQSLVLYDGDVCLGGGIIT